MKDLHLASGGPPGRLGGVTGWRAITLVLRSTGALQAAMHRGLSDLTNTLLPSDCRICAAPMVALGKVRVCEACIARVGATSATSSTGQELLCSRCGDALGMESARFGASLGITECTLCRLAPPEFSRAVSFCTYDHEMREMLHLLKFDGQRPIAEHVLGQRIAEAVRKLRAHAAADLVVVPVPLFAAHERRRGFNQALLLAQAAVKRLRAPEPTWNLRVLPRVLTRVRDTPALYRLNPSQRRSSLRGAFRVLDKPAISGREVLLIDDIMTTGATARECSRVLLAAGAARVWVATAARAQPEHSQNLSRLETTSTARWNAPPSGRTATIEPDIGRQKTFSSTCRNEQTSPTNQPLFRRQEMQAGNVTHISSKHSTKRTKHGGNRHHTTPAPGTARAEAIDIRMGVFRQPAMQTPVLVLNASYEPINICGARRALVLVLKGVARTEEEQGSILHSHRMNLQMPSVIRLLEYRRIPHQTRALSRKNILLRDRNTCQYCQKVLIASELTLDHVIPRCRGGASSWENLVACCRDCNRRKGSQMLHELTEMRLLREPRPFSLHTSRHIMRMIGSADANWRKYLYFESDAAAA